MVKPYDSSWDGSGDPQAFDRKYRQWSKRDWPSWLEDHLSFPFEVKRVEDMDDDFTHSATPRPFSVGHTFKVIALDMEDEGYGIIVKAREGRKTGHVPLCDLEVTAKTNPNYWPVREYVMWFANR
jgi:hypothetical protein